MDKKTKLRRSEWFFISLGILLMAGSAFFLTENLTFFKDESPLALDAFQANYRATTVQSMLAMPTPTETPINPDNDDQNPQPSSTPLAEATPSPTPEQLAESDRQKVFLLFPASHAFLTNTRSDKKGYPLKLRFEVEPKKTPCKFELRHADQIVLAKEFQGSPTGMYEISILIRQPGLYIWQVFTPGTQSEAREFVIKDQEQ
jgi:hypothetical protein